MIDIILAVLIFAAGFGAGVFAMAQSRLMRPPPDPGPPPEYRPEDFEPIKLGPVSPEDGAKIRELLKRLAQQQEAPRGVE